MQVVVQADTIVTFKDTFGQAHGYAENGGIQIISDR